MVLRSLTTSFLKIEIYLWSGSLPFEEMRVKISRWQNTREFAFKSSDYLPSLTGRKKSLKSMAVPSLFPWKQGSPIKRKSPRKRTLILKKTATKSQETTIAPARVDNCSTCDLVTFQESRASSPSTLADSASTTVEEPAEDLEALICELKLENERLVGQIRKITISNNNFQSEVEELKRRNDSLQSRVFCIEKFLPSEKDVAFYTGFPREGWGRYSQAG